MADEGSRKLSGTRWKTAIAPSIRARDIPLLFFLFDSGKKLGFFLNFSQTERSCLKSRDNQKHVFLLNLARRTAHGPLIAG